MSSHREAPEISKDPVADSTDLYAFVSPDRPDTVTLLANYIPMEAPDGGPNFYEFGDEVLYQIQIDNDGDGQAEISYLFNFDSVVTIPDTFLYNVGPITSLDSKNWNRKQFYTLRRLDHVSGQITVLGSGLACPPCNIGPLSTPNFDALARAAIHRLPGGQVVYAGQRADGFYVDLGAIFDLGILRPFANLHATFGLPALSATNGVNSLARVNVHTIALQVPKSELTAGRHNPTDPADPHSVIGVWTSASRQKASVLDGQGQTMQSGPFAQVSRLGNPLVNEALIPMSKKDFWNSQPPHNDKAFLSYVAHPELGKLLPVLYPGVFPQLAAFDGSGKPRADLEAILMTGIPAGIISGFQNFTGPAPADLLRLNMAIAPSSAPNNLGLLGSDLAGFPNGRRVFDDVVTIELRAIAGATLPLVDPSYKPDAAASAVAPGLTSSATDLTARHTEHYLTVFPYLGVPHSGFNNPDSPN